MKEFALTPSKLDCLVAKINRNDLGYTPQTVWCPTPSYTHRIEPYSLPMQIRISTQDTEEAGARLTPTPFAVVLDGQDRRTLVGVQADAGWHRWNTVTFKADGNGLEVRVDFEGHTALDAARQHVKVCLVSGTANERRVELLARSLRMLYPKTYQRKVDEIPAWWRRPIYCGYGDQVAASIHMEGPGGEARSLAYCIQGLYDRWIRRLEQAQVPFGTVTIDAGWSPGGVWRPNPIQWPDLKGFIKQQHDKGRRVLLWIATWFTEGLPDDWCVFAGTRKLVADPLNPKYRRFLIEQVQRLVSDDHDGYGADGFKIDQLAYTPNERRTMGGEYFGRSFLLSSPHPRIRFSDQSWGCELLYLLQKTIYTAAKKVKPDALITSSTVHSMFHDTFDMVRLHDTGRAGGDVLTAMRPRAELSRSVFPDKLIDADNWIPYDYRKWLRYTLNSHQLGVPCIFYSEMFVKDVGLKARVAPIPLADLRKIGRRWAELGI